MAIISFDIGSWY